MTQMRLVAVAGEDTARRAAQLIEAALEEDGFPIAAAAPDRAGQPWQLAVYVPTSEAHATQERIAEVLAGAGLALSFVAEKIDSDVDWVARSLQGLGPVRAGRFVVAGSHAKAAVGSHEFAIVIDAAQAFGTGHHGTTAGCLDMLDACFKRRRYRNALDLGTGSGVLAIAMARAQPLRVLASDIDPLAVAIARANAAANGVASRAEFVTAAGLAHRRLSARSPFDLICANILAGPLAAMARDVARHAAPCATVILSGLLPHQRARIVAAYRRHGLVLERDHCREGWLTLVLTASRRAIQ